MLVLAQIAFGLSFFAYGVALAPFLMVLFVTGIALGVAASALVLRLGPASEWLIWPIPMLISPFAGVFYPVTVLPGWMQAVALILPPSYVFEGMRSVVAGQGASLGSPCDRRRARARLPCARLHVLLRRLSHGHPQRPHRPLQRRDGELSLPACGFASLARVVQGLAMGTSTRFAVGVHLLTALAARPGKAVRSEDIAESANTNPVVVRRLFSLMTTAGLIRTRLGPGGGFELARPAKDITLRDVFSALERNGSLPTSLAAERILRCGSPYPSCSARSDGARGQGSGGGAVAHNDCRYRQRCACPKQRSSRARKPRPARGRVDAKYIA